MKKRLALVYSQTPSEWVSCQSITYNLKKAYDLAFPDWEIVSFDLSPNKPQLHIWQSAREIKEFSPDTLAIIDHKPHPRKLLETLKELYQNAPLPALKIHLFGDYALYAKEWQLCQGILGQTPTCLITASERQQQFVSQFILGGEKNLEVLPFPVDQEHFHFEQSLRDQGRAWLNLGCDEKALVFTGRLSAQKNILLLLQEMHATYREISHPVQLFLVGPMDDLGLPYFGVEFLDGHYFQLLHQFLQTTEADFRARVHFMGPQEAPTLLKILCASDVFISLGQHNDEDYGMSPAEAVCSGLPTLLTDWGGYTSFAKSPEVQLLPLAWGESHFQLNHEEFKEKLRKLLALNLSKEERLRLSHFYQKHFSVQDVAIKLREIYQKECHPILGLHPKNEIFSALISREAPFHFGGQSYAYYREIYQAYWAK